MNSRVEVQASVATSTTTAPRVATQTQITSDVSRFVRGADVVEAGPEEGGGEEEQP